jgi:pimeloyl-ACP methyl ester carboxylesterase
VVNHLRQDVSRRNLLVESPVMDTSLWLIVLTVGTAVVFDFTNGFHDTANAMATTIATRALPPRAAVGLAAVLRRMRRLFVPGLGAPPSIYARALDASWRVVRAPSFAESGGSLRLHVSALVAELDAANEPATVAGHSMGAAVAVLATLERTEAVARLVLVSPAGLPLTKPIHASLRDFARQLRAGSFPLTATLSAVGSAARAPRAAARLVRKPSARSTSRPSFAPSPPWTFPAPSSGARPTR